MIINNEPFLIEYNVRMGDPECQTLLPKLDTDLFEILNSCCDNELNKTEIRWNNKKSLCIVMCSKGYPDTYKKNIEIKNMDFINFQPNDFLFPAGTVLKNNSCVTNGDRLLTCL